MALKTVGNLKDSVSGLLQGLNLDRVVGLNEAIYRAVRTTLQNADIPEAIGRESVTIYDGVYDYLAPTTIFGSALIDLRPQGIAREIDDSINKRQIVLFDRTKKILPSGYNVSFEWNKGVGIARISSSIPQQKVVLDTMTDDNGWTASGDASGLVEDKTNFYQSPKSLRFNLATSGSQGLLTKTLTSSKDLTDYEGVGVCFLAINTPSASSLTSVRLRIGSDSSNYFEVTNTEGFLGSWTANDWLLVDFDLSTATETGTVDIDNVDYVQVAVNYDGTAMTNFRIGGLFVSLPSPSEWIFQSAALFKASGSNPSQTITSDNDQIILSDPAYAILEHETALAINLQNGGSLSSNLTLLLRGILYGTNNDSGLYKKYRGDNPSEQLRQINHSTSGPRFRPRFLTSRNN